MHGFGYMRPANMNTTLGRANEMQPKVDKPNGNAFDDLLGQRVVIAKKGHGYQGHCGTVTKSGVGSCVDVFWHEFTVVLDGQSSPVTLQNRTDVVPLTDTKEN